ncbi:acetylxylan esterase [Paraflavitalea sp. CAU 1676]|uniref:alpha/beta hydrolase family protein n=1 Tax=Paraflavitalea sp. CAU 1676 TaxID=3032598 RepID=UPI0023DC5ECF|nr:acetylxylan esterase [Paraflavitalea sp. CAU 1676]MDF2188585.1 acetylxylan esterase [Paraflavitalea sp. CAU 1676]
MIACLKKKLLLINVFLSCLPALRAQTSDEQFRMPLKDVLADIELRYGVKLQYNDEMVKDKWVNYARWRYRPDAEATINNVLAPLDLSVNKTGDKKYKLKYFEYHRLSPEDGRARLDYLASRYSNAQQWEQRRDSMIPCMWQALQLTPLPPTPVVKPISANKRTMDGYTIENLAFEVLPGVYIAGSLYRPAKAKGKIPVVLCPDGHWQQHRYRADCQYRCATMARMGCMAISYDLFAWGESLLQFKTEDHRRALAMTVQALGTIRILDYLLTLKEADTSRVAISGGSGGGSHTMLITALDKRIKLSVPVVMLSSYHSGGCPCESGMPVHLCGGGTANPEIAAMAAPRPQLVISDGKDWTDQVPNTEFPYLQKIYGYYGQTSQVENVHLPEEGHDFGPNKRQPLYQFIAKHFRLDTKALLSADGKLDESKVTIEPETAMKVFGANGEKLPPNAIKGFEGLQAMFPSTIKQ